MKNKLKAMLLKEHSKAQTIAIAKFIGTSPVLFNQLISYICGKDMVLAQRAAWAFSYAANNNLEIVESKVSYLIKAIDNPAHPAVRRNILRAFQQINIPQKEEGHLLNTCFEFITSNTEPVAIKVFAMTVITNMSMKYPELKSEIVQVIKSRMELESAGYKARARKMLLQINRAK
jgi:hypothetical protein